MACKLTRKQVIEELNEIGPPAHDHPENGGRVSWRMVNRYGEWLYRLDWPTYGHLGKKIKFQDLPENCRKLVIDDYRDLWNLCAVCGASPAKIQDPPGRLYCKRHTGEHDDMTVYV